MKMDQANAEIGATKRSKRCIMAASSLLPAYGGPLLLQGRLAKPSVCAERISRHQLVRMLPAGQGFHAVEPRPDCRMILDDVEAEFLGRIIQIAGHRDVGDGRPVTQEINV